MASRLLLTLCFLIAVAAAVPQPGDDWAGGWDTAGWGNEAAYPWIPPWLAYAPWYSQWYMCTTIGSSCLDCTTKLICTKVGAIQRACTDPKLPYCNRGEYSATPTDECALTNTSDKKV